MPNEEQKRGRWTSASAAQADLLCPGRHLAQRDIQEVASGKDADFGNAVHEALAKNDPSQLDLKQYDIFESCQKIEAKVVGDYFLGDAPGAIAKARREHRFWLKFGGLEHSGQVDVVFRHGRKALVNDYKSLNSEIASSPSNLQLRDLAVLVWENTPLLEELAVFITQPLVTHSPALCVYSAAEIAQAKSDLMDRVASSNDPQARRVAGDVQCKFCRAKTRCETWAQWAGEKLPVPANYVHEPMALWSPEMWDIFLRNAPAAAKWLKLGLEEAELRLVADPASIPGWCLKPGAKPRPITDPNTVFARFEKRGGTLEAYMKAVAITKEKLQKELAAVTGLKGKELDRAFEQLLEGCTDETKQNKPSLVRVKETKTNE